ncbi:protein CapI, partial [Candidatus Berkelbacteria bacterium CG10_big_fil_rev_8_21_14_0_10_33_10]
MKILVTGIAGFIGSHTADALLKRGDQVVGIDNFNDYYDPKIKEDRIKRLQKSYQFSLYRTDISDYTAVEKIVRKEKPDKICHLAAQAGVRYSLENPFVYLKSNIDGTLVMLETARHNNIKDFIYASSSSVYGGNKKLPFSEEDRVDAPISLYATTKKANELMAHTYHKLFGL